MDLRSLFGFRKLDNLEAQHYRMAVIGLLVFIALMVVSGIITFSLVLQGEEQTLVPDIQDMELSSALVKLQEKELYPRVSLRFSDDPESKGRILEQDPLPGAIVKAGRRISLVVSRGAAQDRVGDYVGQNVDEVKVHLQTVFSSTRQLITIREPSIYVFDKAPAGMILEQTPPPETELSGPVQLVFVVSRCPEKPKVKVPDLTGLTLAAAVLQIEKSNIAFQFTQRPAEAREQPGTIVAQSPAPGSMEDAGTTVSIVYAAPAMQEGQVSGLFSQELPEYPYPLRVALFAEPPAGPRLPLITVEHSGQAFTLPYTVPEGTVLVLQVLNRVVARVEAGG